MGFTKLDLKPQLLTSIAKLGYTTPTKIQELVIEKSRDGKNIIGQSQTGTGKTAAFVLPLLNKIDPNVRKVQALILAPTRELALQIREEIYKLSEALNIRSLAVYGGSSIMKQKEVLMKGPQIVVGTPGRVIDLMERRILKMDTINYFVLDEVDRMLDMGFIDDIKFIWDNLKNIQQVMTFSATITPQLKGIISSYIGDDYEFIQTASTIVVDKIDHSFLDVHGSKKYDMLVKYLKDNKDEKVVIFTQTKMSTADIEARLSQDGFRAGALHGDMTQRSRLEVLKRYKEDRIKILAATDVASRGLNMNDITLVINYDVPTDPESYVHRIGRTARAGKEGKAVMFVSRDEIRLLLSIERTNKIKIKKINENGEEIERSNDMFSRGGRGDSGGFRGRNGGGSRGGFRGRSNGGSGRGFESRDRDGGYERRNLDGDSRGGDRDNGSSYFSRKKEEGNKGGFSRERRFSRSR